MIEPRVILAQTTKIVIIKKKIDIFFAFSTFPAAFCFALNVDDYDKQKSQKWDKPVAL